MEAVINKEQFAEGLAMMFHGMGKVFESLGCPEGKALEGPMEACVPEKAADAQEPKKEEPKKEPEAPKKKTARKPKAENADLPFQAPEEPKAEETKVEEPKTEEPKAEEAPKKEDDGALLTFEQVANAVAKRVNRAKAEGDEGFNARLRRILDDIGYARISEMPKDRYEEFMALLSFT